MTLKTACETLAKAIRDDSSYAWSWHCNIAMAAQDEGVEHATANRAASRFMKMCFGVDTNEPCATKRGLALIRGIETREVTFV